MRYTLAVLAGMVLFTGCSSLPEVTRTAVIHEIKLEDHLIPPDLTVQAGDEVRWVNHRTLPARVEIPGLEKSMLSCEREFSNVFGSTVEVAELAPSKSASLCFKKEITISYNARMGSALPGGMQIEPGTIRVVGPAK